MKDDKKERIAFMLAGIKADYFHKYGMELDEWSAINFAENNEHFAAMRKELNAAQLESRRLHETFKGSVSPIHFASKGQSFLYGLGVSIPNAVCLVILCLLCYYYLVTFKTYQEISKKVENWQNVESYHNLVREGLIITENGTEFLILKPKKNADDPYGKVYEFDAKRQEVRVPLQRLE